MQHPAQRNPLQAVDAMRQPSANRRGSVQAVAAEVLRVQLRAALTGTGARISDLLRAWDDDANGRISLPEFASAVASLKLKGASASSVEALFVGMVNSRDGTIGVRELQRHLFARDHGKKKPRKARRKAVPEIAIELGVKPAATCRDARAAGLKFSDENIASNDGSDRFKWEARKSTLPYWKAGDARYDTPAALERRVALLESGAVIRACRQFWDTLQLPEDGVLVREQYETVHRLLTRALAPGMSEAEWREAAEEDWRDDLRGQGEMGLQLYLMSIFEVADLWTDSVEEWQYVVFINKLYRRVTKPRSRRKKLWSAAATAAAAAAAFTAAGAAAAATAAADGAAAGAEAAGSGGSLWSGVSGLEGRKALLASMMSRATRAEEEEEADEEEQATVEAEEEREAYEPADASLRCFCEPDEVVPMPAAELTPTGKKSMSRMTPRSSEPPSQPGSRTGERSSSRASSRAPSAGSARGSAGGSAKGSARELHNEYLRRAAEKAGCSPSDTPQEVAEKAPRASPPLSTPAEPRAPSEGAMAIVLQSRRLLSKMDGVASTPRGGASPPADDATPELVLPRPPAKLAPLAVGEASAAQATPTVEVSAAKLAWKRSMAATSLRARKERPISAPISPAIAPALREITFDLDGKVPRGVSPHATRPAQLMAMTKLVRPAASASLGPLVKARPISAPLSPRPTPVLRTTCNGMVRSHSKLGPVTRAAAAAARLGALPSQPPPQQQQQQPSGWALLAQQGVGRQQRMG